MPGKLYLCATPIGNLEDITFRVVRTLDEVDLIAAEDTRHTIKLLNHYNIKTLMTSYHEHNKYDKARHLVNELISGKDVAYVTDAGMPCVSDPGEELVRLAYGSGIGVTVLPGACAAVTALALSGLDIGHFHFEGFVPTTHKERQARMDVLAKIDDAIVLYESPHRLVRTLRELLAALGNRKVALCRELTKVHEDVLRTDIAGSIEHYGQNQPRGEFVIIIEGADKEERARRERERWLAVPLEEHLECYLGQGMDKKEAMKAVASDRGVPKRDIYNQLNIH